METVVVACKMIEKELERAMQECGVGYPVIYLEAGLHNIVKGLHDRLESVLTEQDAHPRVLLAYGECGGALKGLQAGAFQLVIPRVDDCISLLLGSVERRKELVRQTPTYFLTDSWLKGERNIWVEYQYTVQKYGPEMGKEIFDMMFAHYECLGVLDTGCYDVGAIWPETEMIAETLGLSCKVIPASYHYLKELLLGPWTEERFVVIQPFGTIGNFF